MQRSAAELPPSRPGTRRDVKRRRRLQRNPGQIPNLVIVGEHTRLDPVRSVLLDLRVELRSVDTVIEGLRTLDRETVAILMVLPLQHLRPLQGVRALRQHESGRTLPLFAIVPESTSETTTRMLYREGASFVFEWPKESLMFAQVVSETLGVARRPRAPSTKDRALERAVRTRLRTLPFPTRELKVTARDGIVQLSGRADALWKRDAVEARVSEVSGIRGVSSHAVEVTHSGRTDAEIARSIRALLRGAATIESETLSVSVNDGRVVLMGTVGSRAESLRLSELVGNVRGVRSINHLTTHSAGLKNRGRALALKLQRAIDELAPAADAHVSVVGSVAVLTGSVPLLSTKRRLERAVQEHDPVQRVANKLEVGPAGGGS